MFLVRALDQNGREEDQMTPEELAEGLALHIQADRRRRIILEAMYILEKNPDMSSWDLLRAAVAKVDGDVVHS